MQGIFTKIGNILPPAESKLEIELRFFIDERKKAEVFTKSYSREISQEIAKKLIAKYAKLPGKVTQTINFIADSNIKQMTFINGEQQKGMMLHYSKQKVITPLLLLHNTLPAYRFAVNYETPIDEFSVSKATMARIRLRYTVQISENWQLDITLLKSVTDFSNPVKLKTAKSEMFFMIDAPTFCEKAPWDRADIIEYEMEFIGKKFTEDTLLEANEVFDFLDSETPGQTSTTVATTGDSDKYQSAIFEIAKFIRPKDANRFKKSDGLKQLSNQVIELDKNMFLKDLLPEITKYYITDKIDGARAMLYIKDKTCHVITKDLSTFMIDSSPDTYILDCEAYEKSYYIFDVMVFKGKSYIETPFEERMKLFDEAKSLHESFQTKTFELLNEDFQEQIRAFKKRTVPYETDGLILTPRDGKYNTMKVYKYKPKDKLSVDFVIKKCPDRLLGISPYMPKPGKTLYLLFSGMRQDTYTQLNLRFLAHYEEIFPGIDAKRPPKYFPYQFQPSDFTFGYLYWDSNPSLDGEVGEFVCAPCIEAQPYEAGDDLWQLHRVREDRKVELARGNYYGNYFKVAELTWMSYKNPLVIEDIDLKGANTYFQQHDNILQKASRNFNSYVKAKIFEQFAGNEWVMDLASGKGQDLFRYSTYSFKNVVFLEIDSVALLELTKRKYDLSDSNPIGIQMHQMDLNADYKHNIERLSDIQIPSTGMDLIICNFAFHYFLQSRKSLLNIAKFIAHYLKPGGRFVMTTFDAKDILKLLNENSGNWTVNAGSQIKYSIRKTDTDPKTYTSTVLEPIGQKIDVLLPFSNDQYYTEYMVNIDFIAEELQKLNFVLEIDQSFGEYLESFEKQNPKGYASMDANDKKYSSLYHYYCFYKKKITGGKKPR